MTGVPQKAQGRVSRLVAYGLPSWRLREVGRSNRMAYILPVANIKHFVPHQTQPTIGTAANLHCVAALPWATRPQEYTGQRPELDALFVEPLLFRDGHIEVPDRPGLGLELDEARLRELAV